jgi:hypothetical protein
MNMIDKKHERDWQPLKGILVAFNPCIRPDDAVRSLHRERAREHVRSALAPEERALAFVLVISELSNAFGRAPCDRSGSRQARPPSLHQLVS